MPIDEAMENEQRLVSFANQRRNVEIPNAAPVLLHTDDLARHVAIAPNGKRYVVATYDDAVMGNPYKTTVFPQQGGYLTLVSLSVCSFASQTLEDAVQFHQKTVQIIQNGHLDELVRSSQG